jgi:tetratricopeptide (TPR) repeat protein
MTDPLRSDQLPEPGEVPERDRDARIESLLLAGLDHYFLGQYDRAISVWTRVLFLDRTHARAKAYIDRARSAVAERQREGDELLHTGAAAVDRGDTSAARRLLTSAVERGAATEDALVLLERLHRLEHASAGVPRAAAVAPSVAAAESLIVPAVDRAGSSRAIWLATGVLAGLAAAGIVAWVALARPDWLPVSSAARTPRSVVATEPLQIPVASEIALSRARRLYDDGRLRDALGALRGIGRADPFRTQADELAATIQRRLLETARIATTGAPASAPPAVAPPK